MGCINAIPGPKGFLRGVQMPLSQIAKLLAEEYASASRCQDYVRKTAEGKELNARLFVDADIRNGRVPRDLVTYRTIEEIYAELPHLVIEL